MRQIFTSLLVATAVASPAASQSSDAALFRIEWSGLNGRAVMSGDRSGHAFILSIGSGAPLVAVTAHHIVQVSAETRWDEVAGIVEKASLRSITDPRIVVPLGAVIPIKGAYRIGQGGSQYDVAAFRVPKADSASVLRLAATRPSVGDTVWVFAATEGSAIRRHPARVMISHDSVFMYAYIGEINSNWTSGAAVLDRDGRVVGINVGSLVMSAANWERRRAIYPDCCMGARDGDAVGLAVGLPALRNHLTTALTRSK